jgi:hypothetical protein
MALLRRLTYELILSITTTSVRMLQRAIAEHCGLCLTLLGWIRSSPDSCKSSASTGIGCVSSWQPILSRC